MTGTTLHKKIYNASMIVLCKIVITFTAKCPFLVRVNPTFNANNVSERYEKSHLGYSLVVHTYNVLSLSVHCDGMRSRMAP